jgi:hypothetical protein
MLSLPKLSIASSAFPQLTAVFDQNEPINNNQRSHQLTAATNEQFPKIRS